MALDEAAAGLAAENAVVKSRASIHVAGVTAGYWRGQPVLEELSLALDGCGLFLLSAPNGAGKSTLLEVLAGYLRPSAGSVTVAGEPVVAGMRVSGLRLQRSDPCFVPEITMRDHLHLYARRYSLPLPQLLDLAGSLGLEEHLEKVPEAVSSGTLRKFWFVCHAAGDEPVWCLDEPFNGVDVESAAAMASHVALESRHRLILLTSHLLPDGMQADGLARPTGAPLVVKELRYA